MSAPITEELIWALADAAGLARHWTDAAGEAKTVTTDNLRAILAGLGLPCESAEQAQASLERLRPLTDGALPPLLTATRGQAIRLPLSSARAGQACRIVFEAGGAIDLPLYAGDDGGLWLGAIDACGYHWLQLGDLACTLAVAPPRCFGVEDALRATLASSPDDAVVARLWGVAVQLYSLRRPGDGGIGDFTALTHLARNAAAQGAATVAISPVHAMFSADTHRFSPYGPSSRLFLNALHIDPAAVAGQDMLDTVLSDLDPAVRQTLAGLESEAFVDWPNAGRLRLDILRALFHRLRAQPGGLAAGAETDPAAIGFAAFCRQGGQALEDHARFEMLHALLLSQGQGGDWRSWPEALRDARSPEVAALAEAHREEVDFYLFLQWQAARGLAGAQAAARAAGMPIGLIADLAIGADRGGSQAWSRRDAMIAGLSVGAPPDVINSRGQDWGLGAFSPHAMLAQGFTAYIEMLRAVFAYCGGVRIDHVLGLARLWLVPDGATSADGAYLRYPLDDLLRLIALESHRHRAIVIGEDLGTVPAGFDTRLADAGLLGIRVLYFESQHDGFKLPPHWSDRAIATPTTHDLPTVAGWWAGRDVDWRGRLDLLPATQSVEQAHAERAHERTRLWRALRQAGSIDAAGGAAGNEDGAMPDPDTPDTVIDAALAYVAATPAPLAVIPIEDLLGVVEQPNLPGTVDTHPNWRRRLPCVTDRLFDAPAVQRRLALLNRSRATPANNLC